MAHRSGNPWLTDDQQRVWRGWLAVAGQLPTALHRQLQDDSGLSLQDFDVLVQLSEADGARRRVTDLAVALGWERSRLSHHVKRMQGRGLVEREGSSDDGRSADVVLTPAGRAAIEAAAPGHVETVRALLFDGAEPGELAALARFNERILARLDQH